MLSDKLSNTSCAIALGLTFLCCITYLRNKNPVRGPNPCYRLRYAHTVAIAQQNSHGRTVRTIRLAFKRRT